MVSKKIKIAHIINYLTPAGKEVGIVKLVNHMNPDRFQPYLIVLNKIYDTLFLDMNKTKLIEFGKADGNDLSIIFKLKEYFQQEKIDIVHTHAWGTLVEGIAAARLAGVPVVLHGEHGTFHRDFKRKMVQKIFFALADQILSVSDVLADDLSRTIGVNRSRIVTILNGVDTDRYKPDPETGKQYRKEMGIDSQTILLGTVGRPMKVKNHALVIRALPELRKQGFPVEFVIIGDTPKYSLRGELEELAKQLNVFSYVHFLGYQKDIPGYLNAFDIFVLPSLSEGCSNVLQEAMATGLPVVASRVGGNPELIQHGYNGLLFTSNQVDELVDALTFLISKPDEARKLANNALKTVQEKFSLPVMVKNYENLYLQWMERKAVN